MDNTTLQNHLDSRKQAETATGKELLSWGGGESSVTT
jgi:hypothetical protein